MCPLCSARKPKRQCPGLAQFICAPCCGTYREVTIDCPETCPHLAASRRHEHTEPAAGADRPPIAPDVQIPERFVAERAALIGSLASAVAAYWRDHGELADPDLLASLASLTQTLATLRAGIIYEARPTGALREGLVGALQAAWREYQAVERREVVPHAARDGDCERAVVLLARVAQSESNGRPRSRRALARLASFAPEGTAAPASPLLVVP